MKKILFIFAFVLSSLLADAQIIISGEVTTNTTWTNDNIYILSGWVYVRAGATLTIEPGTVIKGDFVSKGALIIERDADIIADGTAEQPIVFTSQKAAGQRSYGDWGGVIICGKASVNAPANAGNGTVAGEAMIEGGVGSVYGGGASPDDDDNSGILRYVRIEYGGIPFQPNSEINGLTMGGVGRGTTIENVQVSFCGDDAFEWFGGTVNCKNLVAYRNWDDDFDTDFGYTGHVQFAMSVRDPAIADQSGSNGFESDNDGQGTGMTPITRAKFSNVTIVGPLAFSSSPNSNYKRALHLRRNTQTSVFNSVFIGYPTGLLVDGSTTQTNAANGDLRFKNNYLVQMTDSLATTSSANPNNIAGSFDISNWFSTMGNSNQLMDAYTSLQLSNVNLNSPNLTLSTNSPLAAGADFSDSYLSNAFFENVDFVGAFGEDNWASCWTAWDPQNLSYNGLIDNTVLLEIEVVGNDVAMMCAGDAIDLHAICNHPDAMYQWSNNVTTDATIVTQPGIYSVQAWSSLGCTAQVNNFEVSNYPIPEVAISADGPTSFCTGGSVVLTSSQANGNHWSNDALTQEISVSAAGVFSLEYTDDNGCSAVSNAIEVAVSDSPAPTISTDGQTTFCEGATLVLTSSQGLTYQWNVNGQPITDANSATLDVTEEGVYTVTVTNDDQCLGTGTSSFVFAQVNENPIADFSFNFDYGSSVYEFENNSTGADSYFWNFGNGSTSNEINPTFTFPQEGSNTVILTAYNGDCAATYEVVIANVATLELESYQMGTVYPNPCSEQLFIQLDGSDVAPVQLSIFDLQGKMVKSETYVHHSGLTYKLNTNDLTEGFYVLTANKNGHVVRRNILIQK
jgi:hypothetical protein